MIRVRFAPSPTGHLHVGGARTLLFNWLYARKMGGSLIVRIEDTDQQRSTRESELKILEDLGRLGIDYDEGPGKPGQFGPYRQSERLDIYTKFAKQLLDEDRAYSCFCSEELLTQKRQTALKLGKTPHYDGTCARLTRKEADEKRARGEKAGLRFRAPQKNYVLKDHVRGSVDFKEGMVGDFFITRSPSPHETQVSQEIGFPVYNFCCVIDDYLMEITHVIRAEEHLSNTVRQMILYEALGWPLPEYAHISLVLGADKQKLSKRNGDASVFEYLEKGYLPEALLNFLILLGWSPPGETLPSSGHPEIFTQKEMIEYFNFDHLQKAAGVFDVQKLQWMNAFYLHHLSLSELCKISEPFFEKDAFQSVSEFERVLEMVRGEAKVVSDLPGLSSFFWEDKLAFEAEAEAALSASLAKKVLEVFRDELSKVNDLTPETIGRLQKSVSQLTEVKGKDLFMPMRAAITGKTHGPELKLVLPLLGKQKALRRLEEALQHACFTHQ